MLHRNLCDILRYMPSSSRKSKIPAKYTKAGKSFIGRIENDVHASALGAFCAFPSDISFNGQDKGEDVILVVRQHPAVFIPTALLVLFLLILAFLPGVFFNSIGLEVEATLSIGAGLAFLLAAFTLAVDGFLKWFFSVNIITSSRIIDVDFENILYHRFSETKLENVQDVTHTPVGFWSSFFDFGDVHIQTAAAQGEFEFLRVPRPRDIQDTLFDLLAMKNKGQI